MTADVEPPEHPRPREAIEASKAARKLWADQHPDPTAPEPAERQPIRDLEGDVDYELHRLKVREVARTRHAAEQRKSRFGRGIKATKLGDLLAEPDDDQAFRVDQLLPRRGRAVLSASFKSGKSTLVGNLVRSLVDGTPFLDTFDVKQPTGTVALIDTELDRRTLRRWLGDQNIANPDAVDVIDLRGRVGAFDILDDDLRQALAVRLYDMSTEVLIVDPIAPLLSAYGLDEDRASDVGRFLAAFDELLEAADIDEAILVHHTGHNGERGRGSVRLRDWPDAEWRLVRDGDEDMPPQDRRRYLTAIGRDVDLAESLLAYDPTSRRLSVAGGTRREMADQQLVPEVLEYVTANEGSSGRQIETALSGAGHRRSHIRGALKAAVRNGLLDTLPGPRNANLYSINPVRRSAPPVRQRAESECASAPIEGALAHSLDDTVTNQLANGALNPNLART